MRLGLLAKLPSAGSQIKRGRYAGIYFRLLNLKNKQVNTINRHIYHNNTVIDQFITVHPSSKHLVPA